MKVGRFKCLPGQKVRVVLRTGEVLIDTITDIKERYVRLQEWGRIDNDKMRALNVWKAKYEEDKPWLKRH